MTVLLKKASIKIFERKKFFFFFVKQIWREAVKESLEYNNTVMLVVVDYKKNDRYNKSTQNAERFG